MVTTVIPSIAGLCRPCCACDRGEGKEKRAVSVRSSKIGQQPNTQISSTGTRGLLELVTVACIAYGGEQLSSCNLLTHSLMLTSVEPDSANRLTGEMMLTIEHIVMPGH